VIASIGGQVYNQATDEPVNGATVVLTQATGAAKPMKFVTATRGLFLFEKLPPGRYLLFAECPGFARTAYGSRGNPVAGTTLSLVEGQQMNDLAFGLAPGASISGKVMRADGAAGQGKTVMALQPLYQRGKKEYVPLASAATGAAGEYKLEGLNAGTYLLAVSEGGAATWYPGVAAAMDAGAVDVNAGAAVPGRDIRLVEAAGHRVAGSVAGERKAAIAWLTPRGGATGMILRTPAKIEAGSFAFARVAPGAYVLSATESDGVTPVGSTALVTVGQKDMEGLTLHEPAGGKLDGEVALGAGSGALPEGIEVVLEATDAPLPRPARARVDEHGKFAFADLAPGHYAVHVLAPEQFYVRTARYRGADVLESGIDVGGVPSTLLIALSNSGASVGGTVRGADGSAMPGATVALVPVLRRFTRYKEVTTDQFGEFHFVGVAPGDYKVFAWEQVATGAYQDAGWLKRYEARGQAVEAKPGGHETLALKVIP
jgi:hypothetical protein